MLVSRFQTAIYGAALTGLSLFGALLIGLMAGSLTAASADGRSLVPWRVALASMVFLAIVLAGSAIWGVWMGRLAHNEDTGRMACGGMLGFVPATFVVGVGLALLEPVAVNVLGARWPLYRVFTLLFVPAAFLVASTSCLALGWALRSGQMTRRLALSAGSGGAVAFLMINLSMEALGWRVGGPHAAEHFTMLTVLFVSSLGSALAAGAATAIMVTQRDRHPSNLRRALPK